MSSMFGTEDYQKLRSLPKFIPNKMYDQNFFGTYVPVTQKDKKVNIQKQINYQKFKCVQMITGQLNYLFQDCKFFCKSKYFQALNAYITVKCIYNDLKCNNGQDKQQILLQSMKKEFIQ